MYNRILVPLDGSKRAEAALPVAIELANQTGSSLLLLRVAEVKAPHFNSVVHEVEVMAEANHYLNGVRQILTDEANRPLIEPPKVQTAVVYGPTVKQLTELAPFDQSDLIVMTTHAHTGLFRLVLGSVATDVVRRAKLPVILVRPGQAEQANPFLNRLDHFHSFQRAVTDGRNLQPRILVNLDESLEAEKALSPAVELAERLNASIDLLYVDDLNLSGNYRNEFGFLSGHDQRATTLSRNAKAHNYLETVQTRLIPPSLNCNRVVRTGKAATEISKYASEAGVTLLAITTHARKRLGNVLLGSLAEEVLRTIHLPVLMVYSGSAL